jgi:hypothetical protein
MALFDSQYSLGQNLSPFTNNMFRPSGQKQGDFGKTLGGLGLSSLMGPQPQPRPGLGERPAGASDQDWQRYTDAVAEQHQKRLDGDMSRYIGTGEGTHKFQQFIRNNDLGSKLSIASPFLNTRPVDDRDLRPFPRPVDDRDLRPFPRPVDDRDLRPPPTTPMPGDVGYVPYGSSNNQLPTPTPTPTPMPGDVGYVPYGSSNNQPLVQGLAGGGPVGTLSFVELLKQIMEN